MRVTYVCRDTWNGNPVEFTQSIGNTIVEKITPDSYNRGAIEKVNDQVENLARFVGNLMSILADRKLLDDKDIQDLFGYGFDGIRLVED